MSSSLLDRLQEKTQQVASQVLFLKKERERLLAEVGLMGEENRRARRLSREHQELLVERDRLRERLEKLVRRLEGLKI